MSTQDSVISDAFGKLMKKVIPIPKTPRAYRSHEATPKKAEGYIPTGQIGNPVYEAKLQRLAEDIKVFDKFNVEPIGKRDWCYLLESLGKIQKTEFKKCGDALTDCIKLGYLPILGFFAEDEDDSREFKNIIEATDPSIGIKEMQDTIAQMKQSLIEKNTDFWKDEKYYVMMIVEKKAIKNLFIPICQAYHVPIVSSKGWIPLPILGHIAEMAKDAESKGLIPVILQFGDLDPVGVQITDMLKEKLEEVYGATDYDPKNLIVKRVGLNIDTILKYGISYLLITEEKTYNSYPDYIRKYAVPLEPDGLYSGVDIPIKCEANALFIDEKHKNIARMLCREAIEEFYGKDAVERFKKKTIEVESSSPDLYSNPEWEEINKKLETLKSKAESIQKETSNKSSASYVEPTICYVKIGKAANCPECCEDFKFEPTDIDYPKTCPYCHKVLLLKDASTPEAQAAIKKARKEEEEKQRIREREDFIEVYMRHLKISKSAACWLFRWQDWKEDKELKERALRRKTITPITQTKNVNK
jgi:hypothetical protein